MAKDTVAEIKARLSIQDIVAPYVKLKRAGKSLTGLCPFHKEKTPSFHVSLERGSWHCFGCGLGGDGFSFIEKIEGVEFKEALKLLADKAGVVVEYSHGASKEEASKKERMRSLLTRAQEFYAKALPGSPAEAYAASRGLTDESVLAWGLGYARDDWRVLLEVLTSEGYTTGEMLAAGLIKEADGKPGTYYDRFRNRLMFPIRDTGGKVVGFTGRIVPSTKPASGEAEPAKYLNSPETELFHKSEVLFGIDRAKDAIRTRKFTLLVEGQMDVLLSHQAGFQNTVALSGTALSERHLALLKRYSENLMLVLDADTAGRAATARSAELALALDMRVKAVRLPAGKDPADLVREDAKEFANRIKDAKTVVDFFLAELGEKERDPHRLIRAVEAVVVPLVAAVKSPIEREHFVAATARTLGISTEAVRESVAAVKKSELRSAIFDANKEIASAPKVAHTERRARELRAFVDAYPDHPLAEKVKTEYNRITEADLTSLQVSGEAELFLIEQTLGESPTTEAVEELLRAFEEAYIREAYQEAVRTLRQQEASGDAGRIREAQERCTHLSARLAKLGR